MGHTKVKLHIYPAETNNKNKRNKIVYDLYTSYIVYLYVIPSAPDYVIKPANAHMSIYAENVKHMEHLEHLGQHI